LNLSKKCNQYSDRLFVIDGREKELVSKTEEIVYQFSNSISDVIDLPDGGSVALISDGTNADYDDQNIFAFNANGSLRWRNQPRQVRRVTRSPFKAGAHEEARAFQDLFYELGSGATRKRSKKYFDGAILAALTGWHDLYDINMNTGEIAFRRNTGSHDQD